MSPQVRRVSQRAIALTVGAVAPIVAGLGVATPRAVADTGWRIGMIRSDTLPNERGALTGLLNV
jgi:hypothetical protein